MENKKAEQEAIAQRTVDYINSLFIDGNKVISYKILNDIFFWVRCTDIHNIDNSYVVVYIGFSYNNYRIRHSLANKSLISFNDV